MANLPIVPPPAGPCSPGSDPWQLRELAGHLTEVSGEGSTTVAMRLVHEAQRLGEPAAWILGGPPGQDETFYPPDLAEMGIDLDALAVVRLTDPVAIPRAADYLVRSAAFGLVVLELGAQVMGDRLLTRLLGLARKHETAVLCLTDRPPGEASLGGLIALRVLARRQRVGPVGASTFACTLTVLKDKRRAPAWQHGEIAHGPPGLR